MAQDSDRKAKTLEFAMNSGSQSELNKCIREAQASVDQLPENLRERLTQRIRAVG